MTESSAPKFWQAFGPGLLFAGTAVGLSHLVQSTRAGALYGLGLAGVVLLIHALKYPLFRFGAYYACVSGESLVEGYRRQGLYAVWLLLAAMVVYMFFAVGAIGVLTAALIQIVLDIDLNTTYFGSGILVACALFLMVGRFHWLDRINKVLIAVLSVSTLAATLAVLPNLEWALWPSSAPPADIKLMLFLAALAGFMPVSADSSVWTSVWTIAKAKDSGRPAPLRHVLSDFNIGYWGSAFFAVCFVIMGAAVMNRAGIEPAEQAAPFAQQVLDLYLSSLGEWARPIVGTSVISVMLTTALAGLDALPRVLVVIFRVLRGKPSGMATQIQIDSTLDYRIFVILLAGGSIAAIFFLLSSFRAFLDFGTTVAFIVAPIIAILNHRAVFRHDLSPELHPSKLIRNWSIVGIIALTLFAFFYLFLLAGGYLD